MSTTVVNVFCCGHKRRRRRKVRIVPHIGVAVEQTQPVLKTPQYQGSVKGETVMAFELPATHQVTVTAETVDKKGNPAPVENPSWTTNNSDVLSLTPSEDGKSCLVKAVGPLGDAGVTFSADGDLGEGEKPIVGTFDVSVVAGDATVVVLSPSAPEEQV